MKNKQDPTRTEIRKVKDQMKIVFPILNANFTKEVNAQYCDLGKRLGVLQSQLRS
jgi:hypothetical protein